MATTKRIGVVGAFLVALVLGAPGTAAAQDYAGRLRNVGDEPQASGSFTVTTYTSWDGNIGNPAYRVMLVDVSCRKLTVGATYVVIATTTWGNSQRSFVAKQGAKSGEVLVGGSGAVYWNTPPLSLLSIEVYRVDGSELVPVLAFAWAP